MATQNFISDLWGVNGLTYANVGVFKSHSPTSTPRASLGCTFGGMASDPKISKGDSVNGYRAPIAITHFQTPMMPPKYREQNSMDPLQQKELNLAMERIAVPDPRMNITGNHVTYEERLQNMDVQTATFNYSAIFGIVGILLGVVAIVWLARRK